MDFNTEDTAQGEGIINEEVIIESLFCGCDTQGTGLARVSKLVEYLHAVAGDNVEFGGNFDDLVMLLDPKGNDREIDIDTYRNGMLHWIEGIRCQNNREEIYYSDPPSLGNQTASDDEWMSMNGSRNEDSRRSMNVTSESVEGLGGESPLKQDWELVTKIEDLQLNNKRLADHNVELSFQMENTEESNNQLLNEVELLRKQLRSYQTLDEKNKNIEKENEELRQTVTDLQETSHNFQNKTRQLEKDRLMLSEFQEELQTKLSAAHRRLESLSKDHKNVCLAYNEEKQKLIELEEFQDVKDEIDKESTGTQEYLTNVISDLTLQKETLQTERNKMEAELFQVREDLNRLMVRNASTFSSTERRSLLQPPVDAAANSLQQELQEIARDDCLPSPIVGHSPSFNQNSSCESDVFERSTTTTSLASPLSLLSLNSSSNSPLSKSNEYFAAVSQVAADFREKKEKALQTISELVRLEKTRENKEIRDSLQRELEKEMEFFAEKIWLLSLARKASEKRVSKLLALIESLKDENHELQQERDKALQKIGNLSLGSEDMETKMEELVSELQASLENSKYLEKRCSELQNKLKKAENELECIRLEKESLSSSLEQADDKLSSKHRELERKYKELQDDHDIALAKVTKMEREMERMSLDLAVEKKRSSSLQESLSLSVSKHEQELQDIMETIPTEAYNESHSRATLRSPAITGYQVRSKLRSFLADNYLRVRDSPDGKPTNHEDEIPVGVSTPIDGISVDSKCFSNPPSNISRSNSNDNPGSSDNCPSRSPHLADTPYPNNEVKTSDALVDSMGSSSSKKCDQSSRLSSISPNLIRPFDVRDDRWISPNLLEPFEGDGGKNITFTKPGHSTELHEWRGIRDTSRSVRDAESFGNARSLVETRNTTENSQGTGDDCAKNLLTDFSAEVTNNSYRSLCLSAGQYSGVPPLDSGRDSAPVSPSVPARFRKISNITSRDDHEDCPPVIASTKEDSRSAADQNVTTNSKSTTEPRLVFTFDGPIAETYINQTDRVPSRITSSSADGASDCYDSDFRSSPGVLDSYIDGVSLNSNPPSDEKELEKLFKSVCLAFRTDKDSLARRLDYQERARDAAENDVMKTLHVFTSCVKSVEENISEQSSEKSIKDSLSSLHQQIRMLNECSRRVSSQSHQYGSYQQEARMMSGVDVLISYGENLSRRLETLAESAVNSTELLEDHADRLKEPSEDTQTKEESSSLTRRGSSFYNFVSSMRTKDGFSLFSGGDSPAVVAKPSPEANTVEQLNAEIAAECNQPGDGEAGNKDGLPVSARRKNVAKTRSCLGRCLSCFIKLVLLLILLAFFLYFLVQYSVIDRYFVVNKLHDYLISQRFGIIHYDHEPAV